MSRRMILYFIGEITRVEGVLMLLPFVCSLIYKDSSAMAFGVLAVILAVIGTLATLVKPKNSAISAKEGIVIVGLSWIVLSLFGSLPFYFSGKGLGFIDCLFETVSGFTTTGSTILTNIEALNDHGLYFWRSFTHWIGGMGMLVFILAIIPRAGNHASRFIHVMRAESTGPRAGKVVAKLKSSAMIIYSIYIVLTLIQIVLLICGGMPVFDSIVHAFGTAGTGGLSIKNASIGAYNSPYIEYVIGIFMLLFAINFNVFFLVITGNIVKSIKNEELWTYLGIIAASVGIISVNILHLCENFAESFRLAFFQVTSIISTTGYVTCNFDTWPELSKIVLLMLMFIGGCAGSTAGGMKVIRLILMFKNGIREIKYILHPKSVNVIKIDSKPVEHEIVRGTTSYMIIYTMILFASMLLVSMFENYNLSTCCTSVVACFNNVGPGFSVVGPVGTFAGFSTASKLVLCFDMLAGRLEIFPILMLFSKNVWTSR